MLKRIRSLVSNSNFISIYDNALSKKECEILINQFEKSDKVKPGLTTTGYHPEAKSCRQITGNFKDNSIIDTILHDSYFIIGHLHHVLSLGAIYTISAAFYTY